MPKVMLRLIAVAVAGLFALGLWQVGSAGYIHTKALLAQVLLKRAWANTLAGDGQVRPWPWADTWPVARLTVPAFGTDQIVLAGANGRTLAFGPGHLLNTAPPGARGHAVLGGHRDTHFAFLADMAEGVEIRVQRPDGKWRIYMVEAIDILDTPTASISSWEQGSRLTLVTCFPFDAITPGGPQRFAVTARETSETEEAKL